MAPSSAVLLELQQKGRELARLQESVPHDDVRQMHNRWMLAWRDTSATNSEKHELQSLNHIAAGELVHAIAAHPTQGVMLKGYGTRQFPFSDFYIGLREPQDQPIQIPFENRTFRIISDWKDPVGTKFFKDQLGVITKVAETRVTVEIRLYNQDIQKLGTQTCVLPAGIIGIGAPTETHARHRRLVRFRFKHQAPSHTIRALTVGAMIKVRPDCKVDVLIGRGIVVEGVMPDHLDYGDWDDGVVTLKKENVEPMSAFADQTVPMIGPRTIFEKTIYHLLRGFYHQRQTLHTLNGGHLVLIEDPPKARMMAGMIVKGTDLASPGLLQHVFSDHNVRQLSMRDVVRNAEPIDDDNHSSGVYLQTYANFDPQSEYHGQEMYAYVGETVDMAQRKQGRRARSRSETVKDPIHYKVSRASQVSHVVQLFELPRALRNAYTVADQKKACEIAETCFVLLLKTYLTSVIDATEDILAGQLTELDPSRCIHNVVATALTKMASEVFLRTGWPSAARLGIFDGLNNATSIDAWRAPPGASERTIWSEEVVWNFNRSIFRRSPLTVALHGSREYFMTITPSESKAAIYYQFDSGEGRNLPSAGTQIWVEVEIMTEGHEHPCPYTRIVRSYPWEVVKEARRLGIKVMWQDRNKVWWQRYITAPRQGLSQAGKSSKSSEEEAGASGQVGNVLTLMSYLLQLPFGDIPEWVTRILPAAVLNVEVSLFAKQVRVSRSLPVLFPQQWDIPKASDIEIAKRAMIEAGLDNVGGRFRDFRLAQLREENKVTREDIELHHRKNTTGKCDRCFVCQRRNVMNTPGSCVRFDDSESCTRCHHLGRPCSWTIATKLLGPAIADPQRSDRPTNTAETLKYVSVLVFSDSEDAGKAVRPTRANPPLLPMNDVWELMGEDDEETADD